jgi:hypothetical protein
VVLITSIEIVKHYLGVIFTKTCNFDVTKKHLADKALKAMYEVLKMGRLYKLSVKIQLDLFDKMIKPILLYGLKSLAQYESVLTFISISIGYLP